MKRSESVLLIRWTSEEQGLTGHFENASRIKKFKNRGMVTKKEATTLCPLSLLIVKRVKRMKKVKKRKFSVKHLSILNFFLLYSKKLR